MVESWLQIKVAVLLPQMCVQFESNLPLLRSISPKRSNEKEQPPATPSPPHQLPPAQSANHCASCHPGYYPEKGTCKAGYGPEVTEKTESRGPKLGILESGHLMGPIFGGGSNLMQMHGDFEGLISL